MKKVNSMRWLWLVPCLVVGIHAGIDVVVTDQLITSVNRLAIVPFFESKRTYAFLHLFSFLPVFILSFDRRVHYYKKWKYLIPGLFSVAILFIIWDVWFTYVGVWGFNERYYLDYLIWHLPIEEWCFFLTIPFCCVFIYECVDAYLSFDFFQKHHRSITLTLIVILSAGLVLRWGHLYTVTTFGLTIGLLIYQYQYAEARTAGRFYLSYLISCFPFFLVNGVLTGSLTAEPVVMYNPDEYLGLRVGTVPVDDMVYSLLLLWSNVMCYEYVKSIWRPTTKKSNIKTGEAVKKILYYES